MRSCEQNSVQWNPKNRNSIFSFFIHMQIGCAPLLVGASARQTQNSTRSFAPIIRQLSSVLIRISSSPLNHNARCWMLVRFYFRRTTYCTQVTQLNGTTLEKAKSVSCKFYGKLIDFRSRSSQRTLNNAPKVICANWLSICERRMHGHGRSRTAPLICPMAVGTQATYFRSLPFSLSNYNFEREKFRDGE